MRASSPAAAAAPAPTRIFRVRGSAAGTGGGGGGAAGLGWALRDVDVADGLGLGTDFVVCPLSESGAHDLQRIRSPTRKALPESRSASLTRWLHWTQ